jgi:hypothetical protein
MPVTRLPMAVGRGLDRATGQVATQPSAPVDARNVYARDAKMALRPGMTGTGFPPLAWGTDILAAVGVKATLDVLFVVYDRSSGDLRIYRLDAEDGIMQTIVSPANGYWGTLDAEAEFPVVLAAEADGIVMFAHCEPEIDNRLPTIYYTPDLVTPSNVGTLTPLVADLVGDGVAVPSLVYFSGVIAYTDYMCGWGYGTVNDPDRGDIFHMSMPTAPLDWRPPNYAVFGVKKDPIIGCCPTAGPSPVGASGAVVAGITSVLVVAKSDECYILNGTNFNDFAPQLLDSRYGIVSPRAFQNVGGVCYGWASDGARLYTSQMTTPIAHPLELVSPLPVDFPANGPDPLCFATYDLTRYLLSWCFPDSVNASVPVAEYMLSLWNPTDPRWTFSERQQAVCCAGLLLGRNTGALPPAPSGYVSAIIADDAGLATNPAFRSVNLQWTNNGQTGTEVVQIFAELAGSGGWSLVLTVPVTNISDQQTTWDTALPVAEYNLAMRYVNTPTPATGYENTDPDLWTAPTAAGSKGTVETTANAVTWGSAAFVNAATPIALNWSSAQNPGVYLLEKSNDGGSTYTTVASDLVANGYSYAIPSGELGTTVIFRLTAQRDAIVGPSAGTLAVTMALTLSAPTWNSATFSVATGWITLSWNAGANSNLTAVQKSNDGGVTWTTIATTAILTYTYVPQSSEYNTTLDFRLIGESGATQGPPSTTESVPLTVPLGAPVVSSVTWSAGGALGYGTIFVGVSDPGATGWMVRFGSMNGSWVYSVVSGAATVQVPVSPPNPNWGTSAGGPPASGSNLWVEVTTYYSYLLGNTSAPFDFGTIP